MEVKWFFCFIGSNSPNSRSACSCNLACLCIYWLTVIIAVAFLSGQNETYNACIVDRIAFLSSLIYNVTDVFYLLLCCCILWPRVIWFCQSSWVHVLNRFMGLQACVRRKKLCVKKGWGRALYVVKFCCFIMKLPAQYRTSPSDERTNQRHFYSSNAFVVVFGWFMWFTGLKLPYWRFWYTICIIILLLSQLLWLIIGSSAHAGMYPVHGSVRVSTGKPIPSTFAFGSIFSCNEGHSPGKAHFCSDYALSHCLQCL